MILCISMQISSHPILLRISQTVHCVEFRNYQLMKQSLIIRKTFLIMLHQRGDLKSGLSFHELFELKIADIVEAFLIDRQQKARKAM